MDRFALTVHLVTDKDIDTQKLLKNANHLFRSKYRIENSTIQIEYLFSEESISRDCQVSD
jgi:Co/Zn/Cd efflux system component